MAIQARVSPASCRLAGALIAAPCTPGYNATFTCPECGRRSPLYDHLPYRKWRHLDHGDCLTWLHARPPRVACPMHGVRQIRIPWALPGCRLTMSFERHAIDVFLQADVLGGAGLLRLSWDETWNIMERAVTRGQQAKKRRVIARLGVDEKAVAKGHCYVTLVCDLDRSTVEYIANDRKKTSLDAFYQSLSQKQLAASRLWPWTCGTRSLPPRSSTSPTAGRRSFTIATMS